MAAGYSPRSFRKWREGVQDKISEANHARNFTAIVDDFAGT